MTGFDPRILARASDPETSKMAAESSRWLRGRHHQVILQVLFSTDNANADEIAARCDLTRHQVGRRLNELERAGSVRVVPDVLRATATGRMAQVYEVCL